MFDNIIFQEGIGDLIHKDLPIISVEDGIDDNSKDQNFPTNLPIVAVKNTVFFPGLIIPITVGRDKSIKAIENSYRNHRFVVVLSQKDKSIENPSKEDLYKVGTIAKIVKFIRMPDSSITAILQGKQRASVEDIYKEVPFFEGSATPLKYDKIKNEIKFKAAIVSVRELSKQIIELSPKIPSEAVSMLKNINSNSFLLNFIASNLSAKINIKQNILEQNDLMEKAEFILSQMHDELNLLKVKDQIDNKVKTKLEKQQKDYFLNQQLQQIQSELGQNPQNETILELEAKAKKKVWNKTIQKVFNKEIEKLKRISPQTPDYSVSLNYIETLLELPWDKFTEDNYDLKKVKNILDKDHHGLNKVKDRIIEYLAVLKLKKDMKAPIICLVGPPGVGKTSLGKSIAKAINRKFVRMSLGGVHDESEIRGHRKTYIGAMPGRVIKSIKKAGAGNPVIILDEIDKIGKDFRGDPSSALLEVLDPEQNNTFHDNYLEVDYDLSKVLFIATANSLNTIQPALRDRMEIISLEGYSTEEKMEIAKKHLIPKQRLAHGLKAKDIKLNKSVLQKLITGFTRESGVRSLDRVLARVMRNTAKKVAMEEKYNISLNVEDVKEILGPDRFSNENYEKVPLPGIAVGLAYTSVGGDILFIEASSSKGKGKLTLTGNLGNVMKESATTALSFIKGNAEDIDVNLEKLSNLDIHIHVPAGAIPKDGPSAGITMVTALTSVLRNKPVKPFLAMTGEITLRGKVLPVGGIKEKVLAAKRAGIKEIIMSQKNEKDIDQIDEAYLKGVKFHFVERIHEVLKIALK